MISYTTDLLNPATGPSPSLTWQKQPCSWDPLTLPPPVVQAGDPAGGGEGGLPPLCPVQGLTDLGADGGVVRGVGRSFAPSDFPATHREEQAENLPAIAEGVDEEVDAAVDGEEEMTDNKELSTHGDMLLDIQR